MARSVRIVRAAAAPGLAARRTNMKMKAFSAPGWATKALAGLMLAAYAVLPSSADGATESKLEVLQTKTATYTNVTVTTKAKGYIFIVHDRGMASLKVADLSPEVQQQLGYSVAGAAKHSTNTAVAWTKREVARLAGPEVKALETRLQQKWSGHPPAEAVLRGMIGPQQVLAFLGVLLAFHLFYSYCCLLICRKTGNPGGFWVWVPLFQFLPLLRAAGMSRWWFLACFVPLLNLVPAILWPLKIATARGKSVWIGCSCSCRSPMSLRSSTWPFPTARPPGTKNGRRRK